MRLNFPTRISLPKTAAFAGVVVLVQQIERTSVAFSLLFFAFVVLSSIAFNIAGGFSKASGAYVFFFALLTCIFGVTVKAFTGNPADSNLETPIITMAAYTAGMMMIMLAVLVSRRITANSPGVAMILDPTSRTNLTFSALGCELVGITFYVLYIFVPHSSGSFLSAAQQIDVFLPVGIILATVDVVKKSQGRKSLNFVSVAGMMFMFLLGLTNFSKQEMLTPFVAWCVGATYARLRVRTVHVVVTILFVVLAFFVLSPLSQIGRDLPHTTFFGTLEEDWVLAQTILESGDSLSADTSVDSSQGNTYFDFSSPLVQRMTMIKIDDRLIAYTYRTGPIGYGPIYQSFRNWIPNFVLPGKDLSSTSYGGNHYAHETGGLLAADDFSTGISFSPVAEAFHIHEWVGIFLLAPAIWIMLFVTTDLVCGDLRRSPWGLMAIVAFAHVAPESLLGGIIYYTWFDNFGLIAAIFLCIYVTPILGSLLGTSLTRSGIRNQPSRPVSTPAAQLN